MRRRTLLLLAVLIAAVLAYGSRPLFFLVVRDKTAGAGLFAQRISPGERFKLTYIHSVEKIPVTGVFALDEDRGIVLLETYFPSPGIGLPHRARPERETGQLALRGINEPREVSFFALAMNDYRLTLRGCEVRLSAPGREGHIIEIVARRRAGVVWVVDELRRALTARGPVGPFATAGGCELLPWRE